MQGSRDWKLTDSSERRVIFKARRHFTKTKESVIKYAGLICIRIALSLIFTWLVSWPLIVIAAGERGYTGAYGGEWLLIVSVFIAAFYLSTKLIQGAKEIMFTITINGSTLEELFSNVETFLKTKQGASAQGIIPGTNAPPAAPPVSAPAPAASAPPVSTPAPTAASPFQQPGITAGPPAAAAPTYTLDQLARAGATLAQSGKMEQALALLAKYGIQTVNQLKPEQYGAFATELRLLGAQV